MSLDILFYNYTVFLGSIWTLVTCLWLFALYKKDNSTMDIAYGPIFALSSLVLLLHSEMSNTLAAVIVATVTLWALRLAIRIGRKNIGSPEDERYAVWRRQWMQSSWWYFVWRSYLQIYLLQGIIIGLVGAPIVWAITFAPELNLWVTSAGLMVAGFGLLYESIADIQLDRFIARKKAGVEEAHIMQSGLFMFSRRPNYFGELLIWWGLSIAVSTVSYGYLAFIGPLTITYIITKITGPMLERLFLERYPDIYTRYMDTTSYIIPWFPKRN